MYILSFNTWSKIIKNQSENEEGYYRDNANARHKETIEDKPMKTLHWKLKISEQHLHKKSVCLCIKAHWNGKQVLHG